MKKVDCLRSITTKGNMVRSELCLFYATSKLSTFNQDQSYK